MSQQHKHDLVLVVGSAAIGAMSWLLWRDLWGTSLSIVVGCVAYVVLLRLIFGAMR